MRKNKTYKYLSLLSHTVLDCDVCVCVCVCVNDNYFSVHLQTKSWGCFFSLRYLKLSFYGYQKSRNLIIKF